MSLDEIVLAVQRGIDRLVARLRRGAPQPPTHRRLLVVQIDGLSQAVLEHAMASNHAPFLKRMLGRHGFQLEPMNVGLPTSTPAFQMAAMYGVRPDIPGFHYFDRERQADIHFPRRGHAAYVEDKQAAGRRGILTGGSVYGCVFTGGADNSLFTFATLTCPSGRGLLAGLSPFVVLIWVSMKCLLRSAVELIKTVPPFMARPAKGQQDWRWFRIKVGFSIWMRNFFTMAAARDLYAGVPAVYVNYIDYDEAAHNFGPRSRAALITLRRVDGAIRQLWRVTRRVPEHQYDVYILADHGQTPCRPYREITGGRRFERWVFDQFLTPSSAAGSSNNNMQTGLIHGIRQRRAEAKGLFQQYLNYLNEDYFRRKDPEAHEQDGIRIISAGPNAFLYILNTKEPLDVDALERRLPGLAEKLSQSPGVGYVLARSDRGPVCFWRGQRYYFPESGPGPFADRPDASLVVQGIVDLMGMPSAGDYVIYGNDTQQGNVSFIPEVGAHAGPSSTEMQTFIIRPAQVSLPLPIHHPTQLYAHFIRYQQHR